MSNDKKKKPFSLKKLLLTILGGAAYLIICAGLGVLLGRYLDTVVGDNDALFFATMLGAFLLLIVAYFLQIIIHEGGHLIFGLLTGYRFVSFNIAGHVWSKGADGKLRHGRVQIAGMGGQCLLAPPDYNGGDYPFTLYNLGGVTMNLIAALVCYLLSVLCPGVPLLHLFLLEMVVVGLFFAATNGIPLPIPSIQNDGSNQLCVMKDLDARRALWVQLSVAAAQAEGKRLKDMPEEWLAPFSDEAMDNPIVCTIAVFAANRLMDQLDFPAAEAAIRTLLARKKGVLGLYRMMLTCDGATCELIAGRPGDLTESLSTKENQQLMKGMKTYPSILRTQYALALLKDRDTAKAEKLLAEFEKSAASYPNPGEMEAEREMLAAIQHAAMDGGVPA